jgi:4-amino-4-deoxy-L-arabinose transferase-like glycosyltransferase
MPAAPMPPTPTRPRSTLLTILLLWLAFYASFTLFSPPLLDDADSVHVEVAREMLLRHDYITLYANGIRYLEKAPLLYWSMAACMKAAMLLGAERPRTLAAAARIPLALTVLALALLVEALARRMFTTGHAARRAGLYAALLLLSSFGIFLFTRITIPDAMVCLWLTAALYCFYRTEELEPVHDVQLRLWCGGFAAACALNVLTKGLIGVVFPVAIVLFYLLATRGVRGTLARLRELHPIASLEAFLVIAAPWHILAGLANPTQGHPALFHFVHGHWQVPLPTDGNVRGWFWFYFMNEHLLRYLNLRVPHDYDTAPLWLFWGLCLVWIMPFSAFLFQAAKEPARLLPHALRLGLTAPKRLVLFAPSQPQRPQFMLLLWASVPLIFFAFSTRQEYYVLPALPAMTVLIAAWLAHRVVAYCGTPGSIARARTIRRVSTGLSMLGGAFACICIYFLLHTQTPAPGTDLAGLLAENPGDYALSMGHFLDLNAQSLGLFRVPLALAAAAFLFGPLAAFIFTRQAKLHAAVLSLAAGAFGFLFAAHMGLRIFSPVLTSAQLAKAIAPQVHADDLLVIHGEYESGSTLGFYLKRNDIHILEGRSSNLWYGSFFPDAPPIFETPQSFAAKWAGPQRIFLWQSLTDPPNRLPPVSGPVYVLVKSGGKEIVSNQANR